MSLGFHEQKTGFKNAAIHVVCHNQYDKNNYYQCEAYLLSL